MYYTLFFSALTENEAASHRRSAYTQGVISYVILTVN
ncbi:hypothetical protein Krac_12184 [Ktedonobacter racemifer DSM 44963]|jgi:hypothetical protein|uniref:Uncharacterized protein n=1 Tax=Ktedonobacter racemifer DSM 44963 TaxID=485913 RepID=D6TFS6_KTERA|nr:hypothetical protein Krac_12184 [Ktedonobacter racemifer DSM 44963]